MKLSCVQGKQQSEAFNRVATQVTCPPTFAVGRSTEATMKDMR